MVYKRNPWKEFINRKETTEDKELRDNCTFRPNANRKINYQINYDNRPVLERLTDNHTEKNKSPLKSCKAFGGHSRIQNEWIVS